MDGNGPGTPFPTASVIPVNDPFCKRAACSLEAGESVGLVSTPLGKTVYQSRRERGNIETSHDGPTQGSYQYHEPGGRFFRVRLVTELCDSSGPGTDFLPPSTIPVIHLFWESEDWYYAE